MKFTEANLGRIFILRLEHGDRIPDVIEEFAKAQKVESATVLFILTFLLKEKLIQVMVLNCWKFR